MSKKSMSQKRAQRKQQERAALGNIFNVFLAGLSAECVLFLIYRCYVSGSIDSLLAWDSILRVVMWVGLVAFAVGIVAAIAKKREAKIRKIGLIAGFTGLFLSFVSFVSTRFFEVGVTGLCIAVPVVTVLGLVYFLYQRECFLNTTLLAGALFTNWICSKGMGGSWTTLITGCAIAVVVALAVLMALLAVVKKNGGKFREIEIFAADCDYRVIFAVCLVCIAAILLAVFVPTVSFYLTWVLVIALFAELALYTTKMM